MQAIKTRYIPATNTKPSRIKAECDAGNLIIPYNYSFNGEALHRFAVSQLLDKLKWYPTQIYTGELKDCYVHVLDFSKPATTENLPEILKQQA